MKLTIYIVTGSIHDLEPTSNFKYDIGPTVYTKWHEATKAVDEWEAKCMERLAERYHDLNPTARGWNFTKMTYSRFLHVEDRTLFDCRVHHRTVDISALELLGSAGE